MAKIKTMDVAVVDFRQFVREPRSVETVTAPGVYHIPARYEWPLVVALSGVLSFVMFTLALLVA